MTITGRQHVAISGSLPSNKLSDVEKDPAMLWQIWTRASPIKKKTLPASILESKPGNRKYMEIHGNTNAPSILLQHSSAHSSVIFRFQLSLQHPLPNCHVWFFPRAASPTQARDFWSLRLTLHWTRQTGCLATAWANSEASRYVFFAWRLETLGNSCDNVVVGAFLALNKAVLLGESPWLRWWLIPAPLKNTLGEALDHGGRWWIYPIYSADPQ